MVDESDREAANLIDLPWADDEGLITDYKCAPPELEKIRWQYQSLPTEEGDSSDDESTPLLGSAEVLEPPSPAFSDEATGSFADESTPLPGLELDGERETTFQPARQSEETDSSSSPHKSTPPPPPPPPPLNQDDEWGPFQPALPIERDPDFLAPKIPHINTTLRSCRRFLHLRSANLNTTDPFPGGANGFRNHNTRKAPPPHRRQLASRPPSSTQDPR
ncbi:hypothetical protein GJ744_004015 [Endocarpon pusillum]|uniref:Uncharacterized protein n=1 Tax=Endocarpon pusillum TaxID=364733 RepID=A0A8H7E096_9EURO|nr:hypothetical protein GJ744_004015 [Endocarpon pusillum]